MKIAVYHGYELSGSGSNEYTRYLSLALARLGHDVALLCGEPSPEQFDFLSRAVAYDQKGAARELFSRPLALQGRVTLHRLPRTSVLPVFIADQPHDGPVKTFAQLDDAELEAYHRAMVTMVERVLEDERPDVLHANHLVYQPVVAAEACARTSTPFYIVPHGSAIEYTISADARYLAAARQGLRKCAGIAWISREVRERVHGLYPDLVDEIERKSHSIGVGTDTSLFAPLPKSARRDALTRLAAMSVPGGKTPQQRAELCARLDAGDIEATCAYREAYDHRLPDEDLAEILRRIPVERDLLFFVGALTYGKGVQALIAALPGVLERRPDTHLVVVGSGTYREVLEGLLHALASGNERLFDTLVARGRDLELADIHGSLDDLAAYARLPAQRALLFEQGPLLRDRVHLLGRLDHARLRCVFPCCRIAVFPAVVKEASPLVFAEAMANGVLPAASYHSGLRDGLDDLRPHLPDPIWQSMRLEVDPQLRIAGIVRSLSHLLGALEEVDLAPRLRLIAERHYDWTSVAGALVEAAGTMISRPGLNGPMLG